jgi:hypothetical protein
MAKGRHYYQVKRFSTKKTKKLIKIGKVIDTSGALETISKRLANYIACNQKLHTCLLMPKAPWRKMLTLVASFKGLKSLEG